MTIGVLTSSRADIGIYLPLINKMKEDEYFSLTIIAFGTHGSSYYGDSVNEIHEAGFKNVVLIHSLLMNDSPIGISTSYGLTVIKFADYWSRNKFDLVICLGDRYEMSAAVQAGIPYGVRYAHIHGGESTLGATDDVYRHQITLAASIHFPSTEVYKEKIQKLTLSNEHIHCVGSLSLDGIEDHVFMKENAFRRKYSILDEPYILVTFHPETVNYERNQEHAFQIKKVLKELCKEYIIVVTMPNADTNGTIFRRVIHESKNEIPTRIVCVESFGKADYFNAMKYSEFLIGNTSSGIIEAASFGKYVVNVGDRQKGRARSNNVFDCSFQAIDILDAVSKVKVLGLYNGENIYCKPETVNNIISKLKKYHEAL